jgi:hypothetical protein
MANTHIHRATPAHHRVCGWVSCVAPIGRRGPATHCDGTAHGCITITDVCRCGARRMVEVNGLHERSSGWTS